LRALLLDLDAWIRSDVDPPASRYPTVAGGDLLPRTSVEFPAVPSLAFPAYMPQVWRMDYGNEWTPSRVITNEPPRLGAPYPLLVPRVNADGNDEGGVRLPEIAAPLGTYTGWNVTVPPLPDLGHLAGLVGTFEPFARTRRDRDRAGDARPSLAERYRNRKDYLNRVAHAAADLVRERLLLPEDVRAVLQRADAMWSAIVDGEAPQ
jgi:hypothetical protein